MVARYVPNPAGVVALEAALGPAMLDRAEVGAEYARTLAAEHSVTGAFEASISAEIVDGTACVVADDEAAVSIEFGTSDTEGLHVLARAADYLQNG